MRRLSRVLKSRIGEARTTTVALLLALAWAGVVFGFYFAFKAGEIWPKIVEVLGGG